MATTPQCSVIWVRSFYQLLQHGGGGPGFGLLFRSAFGRHRLKSLYHDFHLESRRMMRAMAMDEPEFGMRQVLCRRPFLAPRFGMIGRGRLVFQPLRPMFRSAEQTAELQSLMRTPFDVFR